MNKKFLLIAVMVLSLSMGVGCQKASRGADEDKPKKGGILVKDEEEKEEIGNRDESPLIKIESDLIDFSNIKYKASETDKDPDLEKVIVDYLEYNKDEDDSLVYHYNNIDLNGDGKKEAFVFLIGDYVSGSGGSVALLIDREKLEVISDFTLVRVPVVISEEETNGYKDIIMQVSDASLESSYVIMQYDGQGYPSNPSMLEKIEDGTSVKGLAIIANEVSRENGIEIE